MMEFYDKSVSYVLSHFQIDKTIGKSSKSVTYDIERYGLNKLTQKKKDGFLGRLLCALKEPMILILIFSFIIAFGTKLGSFFKTGQKDFTECMGILVAILLSVTITLVMEGSSKKAFEALNKIYDNLSVRVIRDGVVLSVNQQFITVGDIVIIENGDKIVADGRLIECNDLSVDESTLTGESIPSKKDCNALLPVGTPIAERRNCVFSGTFISSGSGKMVVTGVGDNTEIGRIASELSEKKTDSSPLEKKLAKLGKTISIIGAVCAILVFLLSIVRTAMHGNLTYSNVQTLFIECIILIVAAVPEGLPTIVALSLALNMIKLAKENALIKKMVATETMGSVSVICSDKTGTLTLNKMNLEEFCTGELCYAKNKAFPDFLLQNFICNTTADVVYNGKTYEYVGSGTECALIVAAKNKISIKYEDYRQKFAILRRIPFDSKIKYMITVIDNGGRSRALLKGAPEQVFKKCSLTKEKIASISKEILNHQQQQKRVLCFAHKEIDNENDCLESGYVFDGFAVLSDPIRKDVITAVKKCEKAGIKIKMLTGDNSITAYAIAKQLGIANNESEVINASYIDGMDDLTLKKLLKKVTVIARSTPMTKLRVVRALKEMGEVVAVTGDGINDAPAIRHADVGVSMGISGSEICKEASDLVLLDDSFSTVVTAITFGRNVYRNLQRFILFQLSVNLSALFFITVCALLGLNAPFNTLQLLWINVIMDGPPALTLGLEKASDDVMKLKPVKKDESIVSLKMLMRIIFNGIFIGGVVLLEYLTNFMKVPHNEIGGVVFTVFILFQLFNAFNSRELGSKSIFSSVKRNKVMVITFVSVFILHFIIVNFLSELFFITSLSLISWVKCILVSLSVVAVSEIYKLLYRTFKFGSIFANKKSINKSLRSGAN